MTPSVSEGVEGDAVSRILARNPSGGIVVHSVVVFNENVHDRTSSASQVMLWSVGEPAVGIEIIAIDVKLICEDLLSVVLK